MSCCVFPLLHFFMFYILSIFSSTRNFSKNSHNPYVFTVYEDFISISPYLSEPDFSEDDGSWIFIKLQFPFKWQYIQNLWIDFIVLGKVENVKKLTNDERQLRIKVNLCIFKKVKTIYTWRLKINIKLMYCKMNSKSSKLSCFALKDPFTLKRSISIWKILLTVSCHQ